MVLVVVVDVVVELGPVVVVLDGAWVDEVDDGGAALVVGVVVAGTTEVVAAGTIVVPPPDGPASGATSRKPTRSTIRWVVPRSFSSATRPDSVGADDHCVGHVLARHGVEVRRVRPHETSPG